MSDISHLYTYHTYTNSQKSKSKLVTMEPGVRTILLMIIIALCKIIKVPIPEMAEFIVNPVYTLIEVMLLLNGIQWIFRTINPEREEMIMGRIVRIEIIEI